MKKLTGKTALVTGASSGIGKSTVRKLLQSGATVYAAARRLELMNDLEADGAFTVKMDITDEKSLLTSVNSILEKEGSIDILVNNAGYGSYGAVEDVAIEEAKRQFEVNIFGAARLIQLVLPGMRKNHYGKIVNISSIGGKIYSRFGAWYHATKHALEGLSDCLRNETEAFGIDVIIIEPGGIRTEWGSIAAQNLRKTSGSGAYSVSANEVADGLSKMYSSNALTEPERIAEVIRKAVTVRKPGTRYAAGYLAGLSLFIRKHVSDRMFDRILRMMV